MFEDGIQKANNVGVVVSPTRISSLGEFGTPQFVADKLIQAERRKVRYIHLPFYYVNCDSCALMLIRENTIGNYRGV